MSSERNYRITNGNIYITNNMQSTNALSKAGRWNFDKGHNIMSTLGTSKKYKGMKLRMVEIDPVTKLDVDISVQDDDVIEMKELVNDLNNLANISKKLDMYNNLLNQQYRTIELEICDIEHYIEFAKVNACKGFKAFKLLQEKLELRRKIKDEQTLIYNLRDTKILECKEEKINSAYRGLDNRSYNSKVLHELFE